MLFDVTVVVPTKNREKFLKRALFSIASQTLLPREVVVIDDGSLRSVDSYDYIDKLGLNLQVVRNSVSLGGSKSRNLGIERAASKYVCFLDDDDLFEKNYLLAMRENVSKRVEEKYVAYYSGKRFVLSKDLDTPIRSSSPSQVATAERLLRGNIVGSTSCALLSKDLLEKVGMFDEEMPALQDYDLWIRASRLADFYPAREAYMWYTLSSDNSNISSNYTNHLLARKRLLEKNATHLSDADLGLLQASLDFITAKSVHRKDYFASLGYTFSSIRSSKKIKSFALLLPYRIWNLFGFYSS